MATGDNSSLPAVAKQQRQRSDSGGSARFVAESHSLHVAGTELDARCFLSCASFSSVYIVHVVDDAGTA